MVERPLRAYTRRVVFGVIIGALVLLLIVLIAMMATPAQPRLRFGESPYDHEAVADNEEHDIAEMIEARNDRRRRLGRPEIGDDLARELQRDLKRS
jgi:hypothetical protein